MEQFEIVAALADRDAELPPIEDDPVAIRLGLVEASRSNQIDVDPSASDDDCADGDDPVRISLDDLAFRFNRQITIDFAPAWTPQAPAGMQSVAKCIALGEVVAVFVADVEEWSREPETVAKFFREHPDVSAVALVSRDVERAVVVTAADAHHSVDPVRGWLAPHSPSSPEPLGIALGRHFDRCLPDWERVADLDELLGLGDLTAAASEISSSQVALALRAKPRLEYKKESLQALSAIDSSAIAMVVVEVQSGRLAGDELVDRIARLAEAARP
ncbi:MAG: hypothetical protein ACRDTE_08335 [Pseudonocardiaceae bacterium]